MSRTSLVSMTLVALAAIVLGGFVYAYGGLGARPGPIAASLVGGPFHLTRDDGVAVTEADLKGKPTVMFFGFTFCPEVCPTTLTELSARMAKLGPEADRLNYVFVSVDPERDTPALLRSYLSAFDPRIRGMTGTQEEVAAAAKEYAVYYRKVPLDGGDYTMDHTASMFLMDAEGRFVGTVSYGEAEDTAFAKLKRLAEGATS